MFYSDQPIVGEIEDGKKIWGVDFKLELDKDDIIDVVCVNCFFPQ